MTRMQEFKADVDRVTNELLRNRMPEAKIIDAEICWKLDGDMQYNYNWTSHKICAGTQKDFIKKFKMKICKKSEAQILLIAGEKSLDNGCFIAGKVKNYWLTPDASIVQ